MSLQIRPCPKCSRVFQTIMGLRNHLESHGLAGEDVEKLSRLKSGKDPHERLKDRVGNDVGVVEDPDESRNLEAVMIVMDVEGWQNDDDVVGKELSDQLKGIKSNYLLLLIDYIFSHCVTDTQITEKIAVCMKSSCGQR